MGKSITWTLLYYKSFLEDVVMMHETEPWKINLLRKIVDDSKVKIYEKSYKDIKMLLQRIFDYFSIIPQDFDKLKKLEEEINIQFSYFS